MKTLINNICNNFSALISLVEANLKSSVESTRLGWFWWIISPIIMMGVYYLFVQVILNRGGDNFHLFILTGLIAWNYFSGAFLGAAGVIEQNSQLVKQVAFPLPMLIFVPVLVQGVFASCGVLVIAIWNFSSLGLHTLLVLPLLIVTGLTSYSLGLFIAVFASYLADLRELLQYILRMGFFLSPVLFSPERILENENLPQVIHVLYYLNPMVTIIEAFRDVLLDGIAFDFSSITILLLCNLAMIQIGLLLVRMNSARIVKML